MGRVGVAVLGSTGSIGRTTLEVISAFPERFRIVALTAHRRSDLLMEQVARHRPELAVLADGETNGTGAAEAVGAELATGRAAVLDAAAHPEADVVVNALVGAAGLEPTLAALGAGKRLALANKESLVVGGPLVMRARDEHGAQLVPIDSEHSAIFQCLEGQAAGCARRIVLTASGGPFRERTRDDLNAVTREDALRHPTWSMGEKITVDSATLVNKALEVIEAHHLFGLPYDRIEVVIHPQSIVHSLVELSDGSVLAQLGHPSMSLPVLYALSYPQRLPYTEVPPLDLARVGALNFEEVPHGRFPAFELGRAAGVTGGTAPAVFNAANEEAVRAFLEGRLAFARIPEVIGRVMDEHDAEQLTGLEVIREVDRWARERSRARIADLTRKPS